MRYRIVAKQYKPPYQLIARLADGREIRGIPVAMGPHLAVGDTGTIVNDGRRDRFKLDAIDLDSVAV